MRIIIHFGMYKTGSTSIQETLYKNGTKLTNIHYPDFSSSSHNGILDLVFRTKTSKNHEDSILVKKIERALAKLKMQLDFNTHQKDNVILSAEVLTAFNFNELKALYSVLINYATEIIAVGYIRSPKAYMESAFQQTLKGGKVQSFDFYNRYPNYQSSFEKFDLIFGKENVYFWKFDSSTFPDNCVVRDFCQRLDIEIDSTTIVRVNEGLSLGTSSLLYAYSKYRGQLKLDVPKREEMLLLVNLLGQHQDGKNLRFSSKIIEPILEKKHIDINWMETRFGASLAENIIENDQDAIASEAELLAFSPQTLQWFIEELKTERISNPDSQVILQKIVKWMDALHFKLVNLDKKIENSIKEQPIKKTVANLASLPDVKIVTSTCEIPKQNINVGRKKIRIIVHFGMFKTGSSSIQETLYQNKANLINIYYPDFGRPAHSLILSAAFRDKQANYHELSKLKEKLDINVNKGNDIVLSSEALTNFKFNELKALHDMLSNYTKDIIAVGYIRSPKAYMESMFQEKLKALGIVSFNIHQQFPKYQTLFEKFDQVFGKENVYFWKFDPLTFPDGCVVRDFCQKLNIDIKPDSIIRVNEGLSLGSTSLLYAYSKYRKELGFDSIIRKELNLIINLLSQLQGKKLRFASEIIAPILENNRSEINWMETRMKASLAENITKDDQNAIHSEVELLTFSPETIQWLAQQLGDDYVRCWYPQMMAEQMAKWVDILRFKLVSPNQEIEKPAKELLIGQSNKKVNVKELIHGAKTVVPALENIADAKAALLIQEVFKQMINNIENTHQGTLVVAGLGRFKIHNINASKRIMFEVQ